MSDLGISSLLLEKEKRRKMKRIKNNEVSLGDLFTSLSEEKKSKKKNS